MLVFTLFNLLFQWLFHVGSGARQMGGLERCSAVAPAHLRSDSRFRSCLDLVSSAEDLSCTFADDHARSHGVACSHAWHDRAIGNAKVLNSIDAKFGIDD